MRAYGGSLYLSQLPTGRLYMRVHAHTVPIPYNCVCTVYLIKAHPRLPLMSCFVVDQLETQLTGKAAIFFQIRELTEWQKMTLHATIEGIKAGTLLRFSVPDLERAYAFMQLPHPISGRLSVVITPMISLIQDQAASLQERTWSAFLGSTQKDMTIPNHLAQGATDLMFVTVERFYAGGRVPAYKEGI